MKGDYGWHTTIWVYAEPLGYLALAVLGCFLLSFLVQGFAGKRLGKTGKYVSLGLSLVATVLAVVMLGQTGQGEGSNESNPSQFFLSWVALKDIQLNIGIYINHVAAIMLALVTFITTLVHWFSMEYMKDDPRLSRYWALLGLFAFSMCGVVLANNLFLVFIFWELVGFCSYLLIGFWFEKRASGPASQKAFIVNRIGDLGFIIALMMMFADGESFNLFFEGSGSAYPLRNYLSETVLPIHFPSPWIGFFLLLGVMGKSAQFPLQIWLPDAMAGPTPVSSLLHAATMVAAGVYLLVRAHFLFDYQVLELMSWIGGITALIAAISALTQNDIKGVLAYSTISQLGFMVMAVGLGASFYAYFHLITHAFFKCGLFLAAGAVIHQLHAAQQGQDKHFDAQDIRLMGGLAKKMPFTATTYLVFAGALAGLPLFSGFFSKDGILMGAIEHGMSHGGLAWGPAALGLIASVLTAFYITRHGLLIFFGKSRTPEYAQAGIRAANWTMRIPLILLAIGSLGLIKFLLEPVFESYSFQLLSHPHSDQLPETMLMGLFVALALVGIGVAFWMWRSGRFNKAITRANPKRPHLLYRLSKEHFYLDRAYEKGIAKSVLRFADLLAKFDKKIVDGAVNGIASAVVSSKRNRFSLSKASAWFDAKVIDGIVNRVGTVALAFGQGFRKLQGGNLQKYLLYALLGLLLLLGAMIYFA